MRPILVTGTHGLAGSAVAAEWEARHCPVVRWTRREADLERLEELPGLIQRINPSLIVHCAAWTDVDRAEDEPQRCRVINVDASAELARGAAKSGAAFLYVSSGGVFDGLKSGPYDEHDVPAPRTVYHRSKFDGELAVQALHPAPLVVRLGWLFGGGSEMRKNFVAARLREAAGCAMIQSSTRHCGSPTWVNDAARRMADLAFTQATGLFHVANSGMASRFDYVTAILSMAGSSTIVQPAPPEAFQRRADVPANEALTSVKFGQSGLPPLQSWEAALHAYIRECKAALHLSRPGSKVADGAASV